MNAFWPLDRGAELRQTSPHGSQSVAAHEVISMKSTRADSDPRAAATGFDEPQCTIEGTRGRVHTVDGQRYSVEIAGRQFLVTLVHEGVANAAATRSACHAHVDDLEHVSVPQWREQQYTGYCAVE